ncbi:hypothetical protein HPL003_20715 [Paenibacillus terrae HPL-003]|uniref:Uncharacterized protein n=1 Tax=Paenibacillus terrae (strain HPL-003) TaxID=985665 RepID=G7VU61_PAETH|nr:hypothetical protein HPL003_20715 [Paenibacillus terrae HPL-003]
MRVAIKFGQERTYTITESLGHVKMPGRFPVECLAERSAVHGI